MIIKSLELENIRSYKNEKLEFEKGINFLSGDIGSGKSTILLAIEFALFGFKKGDLEGFHILRKGEREASIKLVIENSNSLIEIYRKIKKAKSSDVISQENGYIKIDDNLIELAPSEINSHVFEILNFPKDFLTKDKNLIYRFTIYTAQEQLKEIIFAENEKRVEVIRKVFNIDKYKQLKDAISIYSGKIREDKKVFLAKLEPLEKLSEEISFYMIEIEKLNLELNEIIEKERPLVERIKKYEEGIQKREELFEKLVKNILIIEKKLSQIEEIENQNKLFEKEKNIKTKNLDELIKIDYLILKENLIKLINNEEKNILEINNEKKIFDLKLKEIDTLQIKKEELAKIINLIELKKKVIESDQKNLSKIDINIEIKLIEKRTAELKILTIENENIKMDFEKNRENIIKNEIALKNIEEKIKEQELNLHGINNLDSCPTCLQEVSSKHKRNLHEKIVEENSKNLILKENLKKEIEELKIKNEKNEKDLSKFEKSKTELITLEEKSKNFHEKKKKENEITQNIEKLNIEINSLEKPNPKEELKKIDEILIESRRIRIEYEILSKTELNIRDKISKLKDETLKIELKSKDIENIKNEIYELESKIKINSIELEKKSLYLEKNAEYKSNEKKIREEKQKLIETLNELKKEEKMLNTDIATKKGVLQTKQIIILDKKEKLKELENLKKTYEKTIEEENFLMNKAVNIASNIEKTIFTKYYVEFSEHFERLFKELIEDNNIEVRLDEEFSPIIEQNGYDIDIKNLSGGEKSSLAISYRLALKQIIENNISAQKLSLLILDEPTDGFSREQIDRLGNLLREINLKQILIVSHDEKIESICDKIFYIEKINHESKILN